MSTGSAWSAVRDRLLRLDDASKTATQAKSFYSVFLTVLGLAILRALLDGGVDRILARGAREGWLFLTPFAPLLGALVLPLVGLAPGASRVLKRRLLLVIWVACVVAAVHGRFVVQDTGLLQLIFGFFVPVGFLTVSYLFADALAERSAPRGQVE